MRRRSSHLALLLALLLGGSLAYGQDPLGPKPKKPRALTDYKPRTLKGLAAEEADAGSRGNKAETMVVHAKVLPTRVRAIYAGATRPLPQIKAEVLRQWARLYAGSPEGYTEPYETEMLFTEDGAGYWLAVKKESLPRLERELKQGDAVDLYLIRVGEAKLGHGWELMLLAESFRKPH